MHSISVENIHKDFRIYERPQDRLLELVLRKPRHKVFHVLQDISFSVLEGRSLGIIGDNGAGKSTLMKLLVGTLQPTSGSIAIKGQVAALLELGAGFHPEFTGRRNIYLNAALLGVPDDNIAAMEQEIIEFSELGDFIDRPVKTYSSGMYVRLAFSIATMVRPDVLVIDEALSVGDIAFQKKCVERMNEFRRQQKTMIFCSHSMYHVQELCDTAIWLEKGRIREIGDSHQVVGHYENFCNSKQRDHHEPLDINAVDDRKLKDCRVISTTVRSLDGEEIESVEPLSDIILETRIEILTDNVICNFGFALMRTLDDIMSSYLTTDLNDVLKGPFKKGEVLTVRTRLNAIAMRVGEFYVLGGVADASGLLWYEVKLSKLIKIKPNKGVGSLIMKVDWEVQRG
ncbi:MAG: ABC transporter ATP-binding protein [Gammaproteobacteria bacterium]|nr:ABC transporter ATP-binding protein [Gammaproteobacteria bacterium]MDP2139727.1 ABC transporter ATP-binding protein [Gammaproteobacteria bacterium]MDP2348930.1 ABC transporter ATP-binding protein [Gammaproteobacteria bacterium]